MQRKLFGFFLLAVVFFACKKQGERPVPIVPPAQTKLTLEIESNVVYTYQAIKLKASGGTGSYSWTVNDQNNTTATGSEFTTKFAFGGNYTVTVLSGGNKLTKNVLVHPGIMSYTLSNQTGFSLLVPSVFLKATTDGAGVAGGYRQDMRPGAFVDTVFLNPANPNSFSNYLQVGGYIDNPSVTEASFIYKHPFDLTVARHYDIVLLPTTQASWAVYHQADGSYTETIETFTQASTDNFFR